ncbi:MAG: hypothetical protein JM58_04780, partial [Peptococcaceae bacterium BICA1-8]
PEFVIIAVVCFAFGMLMKKLPNVKDWLIPFLVVGFGILLAIVYQGFVLEEGVFSAKSIVLGFIQGFLCGASAVLVSQAKIQVAKRNEDNNYISTLKVNKETINNYVNNQVELPQKKSPEEEHRLENTI